MLIEKAALSGQVFERKNVAQMLLDNFRHSCASEDGGENQENSVASVLEIIDKLVEDTEHTVRAAVSEQLPLIALYCHEEGPRLDYVLPQHILPHIIKLLTDKFTQVRKSSQSGLLLLVERGIIAPSQVEDFVIPVILEITTPTAHEDYRIEIAQFMSRMAPLLGKEITTRKYLKRFCELCHDNLFQVRRMCAMSFGDIASVVGPTLTDKVLVGEFRKLCEDDIWGVRKGCAEAITAFSSFCRPAVRKEILADSFVSFLQDSSRWVKVAACQTLGPFITTFIADDAPSSSPTNCASEAELMFLQEYKPLEFKDAKSSSCSEEGSDKSFDETDSSDFQSIEKRGVVYQETGAMYELTPVAPKLKPQPTLDQNQNTQMIVGVVGQPSTSTPDFTVIPMDIDEEDELELDIIENEGKKEHPISSHQNAPSQLPEVELYALSFEENRKMAYEAAASAGGDVNCNESGGGVKKGEGDAQFVDVDPTIKEHNPNISENNGNVDVPINPSSNELVSDGDGGNLSVIAFATPNQSSEQPNNNALGGGNEFNTWQYWRDPIPEIDVDIEMKEECSTTRNQGGGVGGRDADENMDLSSTQRETQDSSQESQIVFLKSKNSQSQCYNSEEAPSSSSLSPDLHRSYMNLFGALSRENFEENGFVSLSFVGQLSRADLRMSDTTFNDGGSNEGISSSSFASYDNDFSGHHSYTGMDCRPRILEELPKSTVTQDIVPDVLLENFTSFCLPSKEQSIVNGEVVAACVYNLPAVILTLGPQNWSLLRDCYEALACNVQWKVRYTLAAALHEIAAILGPELSDRDLVPFYCATTKDLDEVRIGVLRNLSTFIKSLGSAAQRTCLDTLERFTLTENSRNWRFRLEFADQLRNLVDVYDAELVFKYLCPLSMLLLHDKVCEVRKAALNVIPLLVAKLNPATHQAQVPGVVKDFLQHLIKNLSNSEVWTRRQTFAALAGLLFEFGALSPAQFSVFILPNLMDLSRDKVPNVRLKVAQTIVTHLIHHDFFVDPSNPVKPLIESTLSRLQKDEDQDVRECSKIPELFDKPSSSPEAEEY